MLRAAHLARQQPLLAGKTIAEYLEDAKLIEDKTIEEHMQTENEKEYDLIVSADGETSVTDGHNIETLPPGFDLIQGVQVALDCVNTSVTHHPTSAEECPKCRMELYMAW